MKLQMVNVTRKFGDFCAVDDLNLTITNGVYGLLEKIFSKWMESTEIYLDIYHRNLDFIRILQ